MSKIMRPPTPPIPTTPPTDSSAPDPITYRTIQEIERIILEKNAIHYSQAKETPFGQEPNRTLLGSDGTSDFSEVALNGTYGPLLNLDTLSFRNPSDTQPAQTH
jgi:hypothetical protein